MTRGYVITHGRIGEELVRVASLVLGPQEGLAAASNAGRSARDITADIAAWLDAAEAPALIMIDEYGGSCANAAQLACGDRPDAVVVSGVNLAMILGFLTWRETSDLQELAQRIVDKGREAIVRLGGR